jgi:hypothetical protein
MGAAFVHGRQSGKYLAHLKMIDEHAGAVADRVGSVVLVRLQFGSNNVRIRSEYTVEAGRNWGQGHRGCTRGLLRPHLALGYRTLQRVSSCCCRPRRSDR